MGNSWVLVISGYSHSKQLLLQKSSYVHTYKALTYKQKTNYTLELDQVLHK